MGGFSDTYGHILIKIELLFFWKLFRSVAALQKITLLLSIFVLFSSKNVKKKENKSCS